MKVAVIVAVAFAIIAYGDAKVTFHIKNKSGGEMWIGIQGNPGKEHLNNGGFKLGKGATRTVHADDKWAGRFWSRSYCSGKDNHCLSGDCGRKVECKGAGGVPPVTLIEITLKGAGGLDFYDISLVDGYNVMGSIEPVHGIGDGTRYSCKKAQCASDINNICPAELQLKKYDKKPKVIACNSACNAFHSDEYCCAGSHNKPQTCKSSQWRKNYPAMFKRACPDAYSYAYDDHKSTFTCKANTYNINFGGA